MFYNKRVRMFFREDTSITLVQRKFDGRNGILLCLYQCVMRYSRDIVSEGVCEEVEEKKKNVKKKREEKKKKGFKIREIDEVDDVDPVVCWPAGGKDGDEEDVEAVV
jgi:hypothetical protein